MKVAYFDTRTLPVLLSQASAATTLSGLIGALNRADAMLAMKYEISDEEAQIGLRKALESFRCHLNLKKERLSEPTRRRIRREMETLKVQTHDWRNKCYWQWQKTPPPEVLRAFAKRCLVETVPE